MSNPPEQLDQILKPYAQRYVWWKTPDEAVRFPLSVVAKVMDIGDWDDVCKLEAELGQATMREALAKASAGDFRPKSWHFWHYRLFGPRSLVPEMPKRGYA